MKNFLTKEDLYAAVTVIGLGIITIMTVTGIYFGLTEGIPALAKIINPHQY